METYKAEINILRIPSVNEAHQIGRSGNRVWIYLKPEVKKFQDKIYEDLLGQNISEYFRKFREDKEYWNYGYDVHLEYVLYRNYWGRDVTNLVKYTEDAIRNASGIDDSNNIKVTGVKKYNPDSEYETIRITITPVNLDEYSILDNKDV